MRVFLASLIATALLWVGGALAAPGGTTAYVHVSITVEPIAQVTFPEGTNFTIEVPRIWCPPGQVRNDKCFQWWSHHTLPQVESVRIPFVVHGNARATVSAKPVSFMHVWMGAYLGEAAGPHLQVLGYNVVVQFPVPASYRWHDNWTDWLHWRIPANWSGFGYLLPGSQMTELTGANGVGTPPLTSDIPAQKNVAFGVIYIVAEPIWTRYGTFAEPGAYRSVIELSVTPEQ